MNLPIILGAFANVSDGQNKLSELDREQKAIDNLWRRQAKMDFIGVANAAASDLFTHFKNPRHQGRIVAFHFGGHAGNTTLFTAGQLGEKVEADGRSLADYLGTVPGLQLVFLNGCATASLAEALLAAGIPVVIATTYSVQDKMAADLAINFYEELSLGKSIGLAFVAALSQVNIRRDHQRVIQIRAYRQEIPLAGKASGGEDIDSVPWGMYYQPALKPEELYLFEAPNDQLVRLQDDSGQSFLLEMEALERAGLMERFKLLTEQKQFFEKTLIYAVDPTMIFRLEHQLKEINQKLNNLGRQLGMGDINNRTAS